MNTLQYQVKSMRYSMSSEAFALPSAGFVRDYAVVCVSCFHVCTFTHTH